MHIYTHMSDFFSNGATAPSGQGLLIIEASPSHSDTPQWVELLWTTDQPDAETSTRQHTILTRDIHHAPGAIRTHNPSKRTAADTRLRLCSNWDGHM
jgi:hypothetical protein